MYKTGSEIVAVWTTLGISALQERDKFNLNFRWTSKSLEGRKGKQKKDQKTMRNKSHPLTIIYFYWITQLSTNRWGKKTSCQDTYAEDTKQFCDISHDSFTLFLHILQWVNTWGQDKKHWGCRSRFLEGSCKIQGSPSHVFTAELLFYKISVKKRKVLPIYYSSGKKASHANKSANSFCFCWFK